MESVVLIGNGGHAKSIVDSIEAEGEYEIVGFIAAQEDSDFDYRGYKVIGVDADLQHIYESGICNAFICIGYMGKGNVREEIYNKLKAIGFEIPTIIDSTATIAEDAYIGEGTYVGKRAVVNAAAIVGKMAIINTATIVEHDCEVGDFTHVAVNAVMCGNVKVGQKCLVGANSTILQGKNVGDYSVVGMASVVTKDIPEGCMVFGMPARVVGYTR